jgi:DnaJ-class molecular chaperone
MTLTPGEYEFTCSECHGDGSLQAVTGDEDDQPIQVWIQCEDCHGDGTVTVDETDAAERILELGHTPLRTPAAP